MKTTRFVLWVLSFALGACLERWLKKWVFRAVFIKDTFIALANIGIVMITQWGIMNRCSCWAQWGRTGLHLPQMPEVKPELMHMTRHIAPWLVVASILVQMIICAAVLWWYWDAVRVYIQRDDGMSNLAWQRRKYDRMTVLQAEVELEERGSHEPGIVVLNDEQGVGMGCRCPG
jgi:hypothetical protein